MNKKRFFSDKKKFITSKSVKTDRILDTENLSPLNIDSTNLFRIENLTYSKALLHLTTRLLLKFGWAKAASLRIEDQKTSLFWETQFPRKNLTSYSQKPMFDKCISTL